MAYRSVNDPFAETYQNNFWNTRGAWRGRDVGPRRSAPAEPPYRVQRHGKWYEGRRRIRDFEAPMYMVRPHDGKRRGPGGRLMDAMTGEGPDVFVMKCGDKRSFFRDRPQRWQWSGWGLDPAQVNDLLYFDKDFRSKDLRPIEEPWLTSGAGRRSQVYDFRSRKFTNFSKLTGVPRRDWITDARWEEGASHDDRLPLSYRDGNWRWYSRVPPNSGDFPGGRPRNWP